MVGIALRWGLTEQQTMAAGAVKLCLDEIGRCPLFPWFLGHRYGWVPGPGECATDNVSITALEIERGAFSGPNGDRAVIYIRKDDVTLDERFPASLRDVISEPDPRLRRRLDQLRDEVVRRLGPGRVRTYQARYAALRLERAFWPARTCSADKVALGRLDREPQRLAVVPFFIGSASGSTAVLRVIRGLLDRLKSACELSQPIPSDPAELYAASLGFLAEAASKRGVVLLIDALDQLEDPNADSRPIIRSVGCLFATNRRKYGRNHSGTCRDRIPARVFDLLIRMMVPPASRSRT